MRPRKMPAPAKPILPSVSELLDASGLTLTGYVDGTFNTQRNDTAKTSYNTFALQQAAFTLSKLPTSGFGALVNVVAGQNPYGATGFGSTPVGMGAAPTNVYVLQGFVQYATGAWIIQGGKFATLAGAEVASPVANTNTTRSILFAFEPVTNTGFRATYAATDKLNLIFGVNNGWTNSQDTADGADVTAEAGLAYTPSKTVAWTLQGYFGRTASNFVDENGAIRANIGLLNTVLTWSATSAVTPCRQRPITAGSKARPSRPRAPGTARRVTSTTPSTISGALRCAASTWTIGTAI